jgi:hypothetical protein
MRRASITNGSESLREWMMCLIWNASGLPIILKAWQRTIAQIMTIQYLLELFSRRMPMMVP